MQCWGGAGEEGDKGGRKRERESLCELAHNGNAKVSSLPRRKSTVGHLSTRMCILNVSRGLYMRIVYGILLVFLFSFSPFFQPPLFPPSPPSSSPSFFLSFIGILLQISNQRNKDRDSFFFFFFFFLPSSFIERISTNISRRCWGWGIREGPMHALWRQVLCVRRLHARLDDIKA